MKTGLLRNEVRPSLQGDCDRLCGLYSIVNAIVWADPESQICRQCLFDAGCGFLTSRGKLAAVLQDGMSLKLWRKLLRAVLREHQRLMQGRVEQSHVFSGAAYSGDGWDDVQEICAKGLPVLIHLEGAYSHFSVVTQVTEGRIMLFDSDGQKYVQRRVCLFETNSSSGRFRVNPDSVIALIRR